MTMREFRRDPGLPKLWADELKNNKLLQLALEAVTTDHPANHAMMGDKNEDVSPTRAAIELGLTRGYSMALGRITILAWPILGEEGMPESEYKTEEEKEVTDG